MKKILILGKGYVGSNLERALKKDKSLEVVAKCRQELNYTKYDILRRHLLLGDYDFVINCSGYTGVPNIDAAEDDREKCWALNVILPSVIAKACHELSVKFIHISSGCIYNGYSKDFSEADVPNFGIFNAESSFYSKSKHAADLFLESYNCYLLRIRMPFSGEKTKRNLLQKLLSYNNLISMKNSMTCIYDLCNLINRIVKTGYLEPGIYNVVNSGSITAKDIIAILAKNGLINTKHEFIPLSALNTKAPRSNCVLSSTKLESMGYGLPSVRESVERCAQLLAEPKKNKKS